MKRYLRHTCTVCKRFTDRLVDNVRVVPDKCVITLNCQGRLVPIEYRSNGEISTDPEVGVTDWYPRNRTPIAASTAPVEPPLLATSTGQFQQLVLAIPLVLPPADTATCTLELLQRSEAPTSFRQYTYRFETTFQNVGGVESGLEKKTLRYNAIGPNADVVEVYLNGVKQEIGLNPENYQLYDGVSPALPNMVFFNTPQTVAGVSQVDVIVSQAVPSTVSTLTFTRVIDDEARAGTGAWENINYVERLVGGVWTPMYLFSVDIEGTVDLTLNTVMVPNTDVLVDTNGDTVSDTVVPLSTILVLLARQPYSQVDRYTSIAVPLDTFTFERDYFKYVAVDGVPTLQITETSLLTFYPPLRLTRYNTELTIQTALPGVEDQLVVDGDLIVGPDK